MSRNRARHGPSQAIPPFAGELPWGGERLKTWQDRLKVAAIYGPIVLVVGVIPAALLYNPKQAGTSLMFLAGSWLVAYLVGEVRNAPTRAALVRPIVMLTLAVLVGAGAMDSAIKPVASPVTRTSGMFAGVSSTAGFSCLKWAIDSKAREKYQPCTTKAKPKGEPEGTINGKVVKG